MGDVKLHLPNPRQWKQQQGQSDRHFSHEADVLRRHSRDKVDRRSWLYVRIHGLRWLPALFSPNYRNMVSDMILRAVMEETHSRAPCFLLS